MSDHVETAPAPDGDGGQDTNGNGNGNGNGHGHGGHDSRRETHPHTPVPHLSLVERRAIGKEARRQMPRSSHAELDVGEGRRPALDLLDEQCETRVPELVPIRYGRMLVSPFTFYRGAARVMAADLARLPHSSLRVQLCGDAHLSNFGVFASPERRLVFDLNDFDETLPGPFEWDVKRMSASFEIASRDRGFSDTERAQVVLESARSYRISMREFAGMGNLDVWYSKLDIEEALAHLGGKLEAKARRGVQKGIEKAHTRDSMQALNKLTHLVEGERRIISDPPLIVPVRELLTDGRRDHLEDELHRLIRTYRKSLQRDRRHLLEQYDVVDMARKVVGVGSVGTRAWILLLVGRDGNDPLFLQAKEAQHSVLEEFLGKSEYYNAGQRVVVGQRVMQATSDIFLGWDRIEGIDGKKRDFYLRQLRDWKGSADVAHQDCATMTTYARMCGFTLARAHARAGDRVAIAEYLGSGAVFDNAIAEFSRAYADQNERDYAELKAAEAAGRIITREG